MRGRGRPIVRFRRVAFSSRTFDPSNFKFIVRDATLGVVMRYQFPSLPLYTRASSHWAALHKMLHLHAPPLPFPFPNPSFPPPF